MAFDDGVLYGSVNRSDQSGRPQELFRWPLGQDPQPLESESGPLHGWFWQRDRQAESS